MASYRVTDDAEPEVGDAEDDLCCVCGDTAARNYDGRRDCPSCGDPECELVMNLIVLHSEAREV